MPDSTWAENLMVFGLIALPALGNFGGGLLAEIVPISDRVLSLALHAAGGVIIGVIAVELVSTALETLFTDSMSRRWTRVGHFGFGQ